MFELSVAVFVSDRPVALEELTLCSQHCRFSYRRAVPSVNPWTLLTCSGRLPILFPLR